jgi:uncharacterized membrane protein YagU involved in acid resistance
MQQRTQSVLGFALAGVVAGLVGGVLIDSYRLLVLTVLTPTESVRAYYQFVASGALGKAAYADPGSVAYGVLIHVTVSIAWGVGYAYVAARTPQVRAQPLLSGAAFGIVVMVAMQLVEIAANIYTLPNTFLFANAVAAHVVFFGIPVAAIVSRRLGRG